MDYLAREMMIRRISSRKLYGTIPYNNQEYDIIISDPSNELLLEGDFIYQKSLREIKASQLYLTDDESAKILNTKGFWSKTKEKQVDLLNEEIKRLNQHLSTLKFKKKEQKNVLKTIEKAKAKVAELEADKDQLWSVTDEGICDRIKKRFLMSKTTKLTDESLLSNPSFLDKLVVYYYKESFIQQKDMRELARTDPWRLIWNVSKETGTPLFGHSAAEFTQLQSLLLMWTKVYDFAFNSDHRPTIEVIENDDQFDAWYQAESERMEKEFKRNAYDKEAAGAQEMFVPADPDGSREVLDLNDSDGHRRIRQRMNVITTKKEVTEANLPDVLMDLKTEAKNLRKQ